MLDGYNEHVLEACNNEKVSYTELRVFSISQSDTG